MWPLEKITLINQAKSRIKMITRVKIIFDDAGLAALSAKPYALRLQPCQLLGDLTVGINRGLDVAGDLTSESLCGGALSALGE